MKLNLRSFLKPNKKKKTVSFLQLHNSIALEDIPEVSPTRIRAFLKKHNIAFEDGYTGFMTPCPKCHKGTKTTATHLYINKTTGTFLCVSCKSMGAWQKLETFLTKRSKKGDSISSEAENINKLIKEVQQNTIPVNNLSIDVLHNVLKAFGLPVSF